MQDTKPYIPIDCSYYDRLEAWATLRENVTIKLNEKPELLTGVIKDLYVRDKVEYLLLNSGKEIRLDQIASVNDIPLTDACSV